MRFVARCALFGLATLLTTTWFYGWPHTVYILLRQRAYCWLCDEPGVDHCHDPIPLDVGFIDPCQEQSTRIQTLYTLATSVEYALSILPGYVYDNVGVRHCGAIGVGLFGLGWLLLSSSSQAAPLYPHAFFLFGHGINYVALACVSLSEYSKDWEYLTMSVAMMAQQMATVIPPILWNVMQSLPAVAPSSVLTAYWLGLALPLGAAMVFHLPSRRHVPKVSCCGELELAESEPHWTNFFSEARKPEYIVYVAWYATTNMGVNTVMTNMVQNMGTAVSSYYGWISWLPLGPVMGLLNEYVHSIWSLWAITIAKVFIFAAFVIDSQAYNYFVVTLQMVEIGYVHALKIYFINENFDKQHLGKLSGLASLVSGLLQLLNIFIESSRVPVRSEFGFWLTFTAVQCLMLAYLTRSHLRQAKHPPSTQSVYFSIHD